MTDQIPASITHHCPSCGTETLHRTLKGRFSGKKKLNMVLRCSECDNVLEDSLELPGTKEVRLIISRGDESEKIRVELPSDWALSVGDEFMHGDESLLVTGIEVEGVRVDSARIEDIQTLWTKNFDQVAVRVSINRQGRTRSLELVTAPDEEFEAGTMIEIDGRRVLIHSIKVRTTKLRRGKATAREIVRLYCTDMRGKS